MTKLAQTVNLHQRVSFEH